MVKTEGLSQLIDQKPFVGKVHPFRSADKEDKGGGFD